VQKQHWRQVKGCFKAEDKVGLYKCNFENHFTFKTTNYCFVYAGRVSVWWNCLGDCWVSSLLDYKVNISISFHKPCKSNKQSINKLGLLIDN